LISIEILLNGIILLIVCNRPESKETPIFALFLLVFTVILSVIALAILYKINAKKMSIQTETLTKLKD
jgi:NADH:ubiquinone oxidoreductase subunit K